MAFGSFDSFDSGDDFNPNIETRKIRDKFGNMYDVPTIIADDPDMLREYIMRQRGINTPPAPTYIHTPPKGDIDLSPSGNNLKPVPQIPEPEQPDFGDEVGKFGYNVGAGTLDVGKGIAKILSYGSPFNAAQKMGEEAATRAALSKDPMQSFGESMLDSVSPIPVASLYHEFQDDPVAAAGKTVPYVAAAFLGSRLLPKGTTGLKDVMPVDTGMLHGPEVGNMDLPFSESPKPFGPEALPPKIGTSASTVPERFPTLTQALKDMAIFPQEPATLEPSNIGSRFGDYEAAANRELNKAPEPNPPSPPNPDLLTRPAPFGLTVKDSTNFTNMNTLLPESMGGRDINFGLNKPTNQAVFEALLPESLGGKPTDTTPLERAGTEIPGPQPIEPLGETPKNIAPPRMVEIDMSSDAGVNKGAADIVNEAKAEAAKTGDEGLNRAAQYAQDRLNEVQSKQPGFIGRQMGKVKSLKEAYNRYLGQSEENVLENMGQGGNNLLRATQQIMADAFHFSGKQSITVEKAARGLSDSEFSQAVDVLEGNAKSADPRINNLAQVMKAQLQNVGPQLYQNLKIKNPSTGHYEPFTPRENYFPHRYPEGFAIGDKAMPEVISDIMKEYGVTAEKAREILDTAKETGYRTLDSMKRRSKGLTGYRKDADVLSSHFLDMAKRSLEEKVLGSDTLQGDKSNFINSNLAKIEAEFGPAARQRAEGIMNRFLEREPVQGEQWQRDAAGALNSIQAFTKLSLSTIKNMAGGLTAGAIRGEAIPWIQSIGDAFTQSGRDFAHEAGTWQSLFRDSAKDVGVGSAGSRIFGIEATEKFLRAFSGNLGKREANILFERLKNDKASPSEIAQLQDLILEPDMSQVLKQQKLSESQIARAANRMTDLTQGRADSMNLPQKWSNNPAANVLTQFKKFAFIQARNMKNALIQNPKAIPRVLIIQQLLGEGASDIRAALTNKKRKQGLSRMIDNAANAFGFGLTSDLLQAFSEGGYRGLTALFGPTTGDVGEVLDDAYSVGKSNQPFPQRMKPFAKTALRHIPFGGSYLANSIE